MSLPPTLLLADDSLIIQRVVSLTFADQAIRVVVARDGQDAINRMGSEPPDVVLADTNMPCVDGYELARWVRRQPHLSTVPVLLLSGATDPLDEQRLRDSGANGVLEKPFEPTQVISRVKELLGMKGAVAVPPGRLVTTGEPPPPTVRSPPPPAAAVVAEPPESAAHPVVDEDADATPEQLDQLAELVVSRLRLAALREDLERGLAVGLRETVARTLQECVAAEVRNSVLPAVQQTVREVLLGEQGRLAEVVHDTAERLVREEIARIRERRL